MSVDQCSTSDHVSENGGKKVIFGGWGGEILIEIAMMPFRGSVWSLWFKQLQKQGKKWEGENANRWAGVFLFPDENLCIIVKSKCTFHFRSSLSCAILLLYHMYNKKKPFNMVIYILLKNSSEGLTTIRRIRNLLSQYTKSSLCVVQQKDEWEGIWLLFYKCIT